MALGAHHHHGSVITGMALFALSPFCLYHGKRQWRKHVRHPKDTSQRDGGSESGWYFSLWWQKNKGYQNATILTCLTSPRDLCVRFRIYDISSWGWEESVGKETEPIQWPSLTNKGVNRMSRQKTLDLLSTGKTLWNKWRRENAEVQAFEPDLHAADLHGMDLYGADLHEADLTEANLQGADLRKADLRETDLRHADLQNANLSDANLLKARLHGADLRGATLCRTNLKGADFSNADLRGADLDGAILDKANFDEANVSRRDLGEATPNKLQEAKERILVSVAVQSGKAA
jgi:Pentapeptide repeats (8 copies)